MTNVDPNDPRPASVQIADALRARIVSGELALGARLPSGRMLAHQYGVALMTAQAALQRLRDENRVYSTGRGSYVGPMPDSDNADFAQRLSEVETELRALRTRVETLESSR